MVAGGLVGMQVPGLETRAFSARSIDGVVAELGIDRIDLIKMDIEGAEPLALDGAMKAIRRFRPQLAISIYHQPEHFYMLPLILMEALDEYDFFVRNYHFISNETIFYATPKERGYRPRRRSLAVALRQ